MLNVVASVRACVSARARVCVCVCVLFLSAIIKRNIAWNHTYIKWWTKCTHVIETIHWLNDGTTVRAITETIHWLNAGTTVRAITETKTLIISETEYMMLYLI